MLKKLIVFLFFSSLSTEIFSETYYCTQDLERFGRPGETETMIFRRDVDQDGEMYFTSPSLGKMDIFFENSTTIMFVEKPYLEDVTEPELYLFFIEKKKMEFGSVNIGIEEFRKPQPFPFGYGKCKLI